MALNQWFKMYGGEYLSDLKIAALTPQERSCWVTLLCLASISSVPGTIEYLTVDALLQKSGIIWDPYNPEEWDNAKTVLEKFVRMKMISKSEDGTIEILNWKKRQETNLTNAERQARYRENHEVTQPVTKVTLDKSRQDKSNTSVAKAPLEYVQQKVDANGEEVQKRESSARYPHFKEVSSWFPSPQASWAAQKNVREREYSEFLYERGESDVRGIIAFCVKHDGDQYLPSWKSPYKLELNWEGIKDFANRNGL